jgi:ribosomal protein L37AE/L43A
MAQSTGKKSAKGFPKPGNISEYHSREGMAWREGKVLVFAEDHKRGGSQIFEMPKGNFECPQCDVVVRLDSRGFAFCEKCGEIFNSGRPENKRITASINKHFIKKISA